MPRVAPVGSLRQTERGTGSTGRRSDEQPRRGGRGRGRAHRTVARSPILCRRPVSDLCPAAGRGAGRPQRHHRDVDRQSARRGDRDLARSGDLLLLQGDHGLRDRGRVPDPADHDAHRPARPHPLPRVGPARFPAHLHAGPRARYPPAGPGTDRPDRGGRAGRCRRRPGGAPAPAGDQRPAGSARRRVAPLLPMVRGGHSRGHRLARGGAQRLERRDGPLPARRGCRPPEEPATTSSRSSPQPRSMATASRTRNLACSSCNCWWPATRPRGT